jgi:GTP-binding protein Era
MKEPPEDSARGAGGEGFRAGYVAILGRPNAGKSTLLNRILGQKLAITTPKPQTTRHRILGIWNGEGAQIVFLDTPGIHEAKKALNVAMVRAAFSAMANADVLVLMAEAGRPAGREEELLLREAVKAKASIVLAINKVDTINKSLLLPQIEAWSRRLPGVPIVPISALTGDGVNLLLDEIRARIPQGSPFYPPDQITDQPERFFAAEIIREKIFQRTGEEIPYACAVTIEDWKEDPARKRVTISAVIHVEKDSQKAIVIGKGGAKLKEIGTDARRELEVFLEGKVHLALWVKVDKNWTRDAREVRLLGYETS